jgi:Reverse transcriptase (RNA-dependent DNA polymerase)
VISPLLANLYFNRVLKYWRITRCGEAFSAHIVNYADDFVILSRGKAAAALAWTRRTVGRLGLTLNEAKTTFKDARSERFDLLGYSFGPHCYRLAGSRYLGSSPSAKSLARIKSKVSDVLDPGNNAPWPTVRNQVNPPLARLARLLPPRQLYPGVSRRQPACRRPGPGFPGGPAPARLARHPPIPVRNRVWRTRHPCASNPRRHHPGNPAMEPVGEPDAGDPHVRLCVQ